ncbi:unnamed protein product, partial [Brachionus calyciflorus]
MIKTIKNEDAKARNEFLKPNITAKQSKRDFEKDFQIQLIQEEYRRNAIDFKSYFNKLTQQVMSPYEQDLDDDQIGDIDFKIAQISKAEIVPSTSKDHKLNDKKRKRDCKLEKDSNPKLAKKEENHLAVEYPNQLFSANEIINVDDNLEIEKVNNYLEDDQWLTGRHIDLAIDYIEERAILRGFV